MRKVNTVRNGADRYFFAIGLLVAGLVSAVAPFVADILFFTSRSSTAIVVHIPVWWMYLSYLMWALAVFLWVLAFAVALRHDKMWRCSECLAVKLMK